MYATWTSKHVSPHTLTWLAIKRKFLSGIHVMVNSKLHHISTKACDFNWVKVTAETMYARKYNWTGHMASMKTIDGQSELMNVSREIWEESEDGTVDVDRPSCKPTWNHKDVPSAGSRRMEKWLLNAPMERNESMKLRLPKVLESKL